MQIDEAAKRVTLEWTPQATLLLANLSEDFPIEEFEEWVKQTKFGVGGGYIIEFLEIKKQSETQNISPPPNNS